MISISHKAKQLLIFVAKLSIVVGAFYFIYSKLKNLDDFNWMHLWRTIGNQSVIFIFLILFLSFANVFLEIVKWINLVSVIETISLKTAIKQVLGSLTAGIFTPNGLGGYAGKALYFEKQKTKLILFLNLLSNGIQMIITVTLGTIGLFLMHYFTLGLIAVASIFGLFLIFYLTKNIQIKGYSFQTLLSKIKWIPKKVHRKNIFFALGRYLLFSHQFYFLFLFFGVNLCYFDVYFTITIVYFLSSTVPSFQFLDFAIRGSFALYLFQKFGVAAETIICITTIMWLLNVVIPVGIGSYFVLTFRTKNTLK